jgi:hypothetical protein
MVVVRQLRSRNVVTMPTAINASDQGGNRKRAYSCNSDDSWSDTEPEVSASAKVPTTRRGKTQTAGHRAGLSRAKAELKKLSKTAEEAKFEKILHNRAFRKEKGEMILDIEEEVEEPRTLENDVSLLNAQELQARVGEKVAAVLEVAKKCGNLKGGFISKLKESAKTLQEVVECLVSRTEVDESRWLLADNKRLHKEVEALKAEIKTYRREFSEMKKTTTPSSNKANRSPIIDADTVEDLKRSLIVTVGNIINARFEGLEERLLPPKIHRPPLAADKKKKTFTATIEAVPAATA